MIPSPRVREQSEGKGRRRAVRRKGICTASAAEARPSSQVVWAHACTEQFSWQLYRMRLTLYTADILKPRAPENVDAAAETALHAM